MASKNAKTEYIAHFNEVYDATFSAVRRYVALKCGEVFDIPDIVQEVYFEYYKTITKKGIGYADDDLALLITIAKRKIARHRDKKRKVLLSFDDESEIVDDGFDERLIDGLEAERIWAMIDKYPADVRKIFYLSFFEGMSHSEIAGELECGVSNVKNKIYRTIEKIRKEEKG